MKQFTSKLDFSLTKKRFKMMGNFTSWKRNSARLFVLIPAFTSLLFVFCTQPASDQVSINGEPYRYLTRLQDVNETSDHQLLVKINGDEQREFYRVYDMAGIPFTGTNRTYDMKAKEVRSQTRYENGNQLEAISFNADGSKGFQKINTYDGDQLLDETTWLNGDLNWQVAYINDSLVTIRQYHPNGELEWEATQSHIIQPTLASYEGLMTLYDEQGNILEQELYENGKLVEKIK